MMDRDTKRFIWAIIGNDVEEAKQMLLNGFNAWTFYQLNNGVERSFMDLALKYADKYDDGSIATMIKYSDDLQAFRRAWGVV